MLKEIVLLALTGLCLTNALVLSARKTCDQEFVVIQKKIYELLLLVDQTNLLDAPFYEIGQRYDISSDISSYNNETLVKVLLNKYESGMLSQDALFSLYNTEQREEMVLLTKVLLSAKNFDTFYKAASWARLRMNSGLFVVALTTAVFNREDCRNVVLPAPYEIYPSWVYSAKTIQTAHQLKMSNGQSIVHGTEMVSPQHYLIQTNYTGVYVKDFFNKEYDMDYFMEDPSLNAYYFYVRSVFPFWLESSSIRSNIEHIRGALYLYVHQQLHARYLLERWSHDLPEVMDFEWNKRFSPGFYSTIMFGNGIHMPHREPFSKVPYYKYKYMKNIFAVETRLLNAIESGVVTSMNGTVVNIFTPEGINILGNIIEGNADSLNSRFYGMLDAYMRNLLSFNIEYTDKNMMIPTSLQLLTTSLRDPGFYRITNRLMHFLRTYKKNLPSYTERDLEFPVATIQSVIVDKMQTYFDNCTTVINNAVWFQNFKEGTSQLYRARRPCLNNKPFTYRIRVKSQTATNAIVRIFLGPDIRETIPLKDAEYLNKYYKYFVQMDKFMIKLKQGINDISRESTHSVFTMPDMTPANEYYKKILEALQGGNPLPCSEAVFGFPQRLILPKGKVDGMPMKLFVTVNGYDSLETVTLPVFGDIVMDGRSFGFPLDRPFPMVLPTNAYVRDVEIFHKTT